MELATSSAQRAAFTGKVVEQAGLVETECLELDRDGPIRERGRQPADEGDRTGRKGGEGARLQIVADDSDNRATVPVPSGSCSIRKCSE
jgi:hypothetical protein